MRRFLLLLLLTLVTLARAGVVSWTCPGKAAWLGTAGPDTVSWQALAAAPQSAQLQLALQAKTAVLAAYRCRAGLSEADVSIYANSAPPDMPELFARTPLLTLSVPRERLQAWAALPLNGWHTGYDRLWTAASAPPLPQIPVMPSLNGQAWPLSDRLEASLLGGVRGGVLMRGSPWADAVGMSIDDAPHPLFTPLLLLELKRQHLDATFFVIGRNARAYPYLLRDLVRAGFEVGNHSYAHLRPAHLSAAAQWQDVMLGEAEIGQLSGIRPTLFRPPGGDVTPGLLAQLQAAGLTLALWTDDPADYQGHSQSVLMNRLERHLSRGAVLLLHDDVPQALDVLPLLAAELHRRGLHSVKLSDLR